MSIKSVGVSYSEEDSSLLKTNKKLKIPNFIISGIFSLFVLILAFSPVLNFSNSSENKGTVVSANAQMLGIFCGDKLGLNMSSSPYTQGTGPAINAKNRTWTLKEAFAGNMSFVNYYGESGGEDINFVKTLPKDRAPKVGNIDDVRERIESPRGWETCTISNLSPMVSGLVLTVANVFSNITSTFAVFAFDSNIICSDPDNPTGMCFNLLKVIGGTSGGDGGIVGTLTSSIYMPLMIIAVAIATFWVAKLAFKDRKIREAFSAALWIALSVIFGVALLTNPMLLAKAPMVISNSVSSCIIGAFNGENCFTNTSSGAGELNFENTSANICKSSADVSIDEQMTMTVNGLNCSIWKAFVLEPYMQGSFGTSFEDLDVYSGPIKDVIKKSGIEPETYCVNLGSILPMSEQGPNLNLDLKSNKICNLGAYQLFLQTNATSGDSTPPTTNKIDDRWYNIIVPVANDDGLWSQWTSSFTGGAYKFTVANISLISTVLGGILIIITSFMSIVYYISAEVLIAFAALFFLFAIHPGRGKKIFLGWVEKIISNILKYLGSALFLIVAIAFYGAILGNMENPIITLIFILIITGALLLYRKELIEMIGKVNMGGEQISNKFKDSLSSGMDKLKKTSSTVAGSAAGAALATGFKGNVAGAAWSGAKDGVKRDIKRGTGFAANVARQVDRSGADNKRDLLKSSQNSKADAKSANDTFDKSNNRINDLTKEYDKEKSINETSESTYNELLKDHEISADIKQEVLISMAGDNPMFAEMQSILNRMEALRTQRMLAQAQGDRVSANRLLAEENGLKNDYQNARKDISFFDRTRGEKRYQHIVDSKMEDAGVSFTDIDLDEMRTAGSQILSSSNNLESYSKEINSLQDTRAKAELEREVSGQKANILYEAYEEWKPGDVITDKKISELKDEAEVKAKDVSENFVSHRDELLPESYSQKVERPEAREVINRRSNVQKDEIIPKHSSPEQRDDYEPSNPLSENPIIEPDQNEISPILEDLIDITPDPDKRPHNIKDSRDIKLPKRNGKKRRRYKK